MVTETRIYRYAREHYQIILWVLIIIYLINEAFLFSSYQDHQLTTDIINQAGRQRMYSQKIAKLTLYYRSDNFNVVNDLQETIDRWSVTHRSFIDKNSPLSKFYFSNRHIQKNFDDLTVIQHDIEVAVNEMTTNPIANNTRNVEIILEQEVRFLALMDMIVNQMEAEADRIYYKTTVIEIIFGIMILIGLTFMIFFLLVPMIDELKSRESGLTISVSEKEALLSEVHHRVKNHLAIISGIFQLQIMKSEFNKSTFENAVSRVQSIASLHEFLYKDRDYDVIEIDVYINELIRRLAGSYPELGKKIRVNVISDSAFLHMEKAAPFGLLMNELITNSLKHAFKEGDLGQIDMTLSIDESVARFNYEDNGSGFINRSKNNAGIGMQLIYSLTDQLNGELEIGSKPNFSLNLTFDVV